MIAISRKLEECVEKIEKKKVMSHKTTNLLKDIEYDARVLKEEICENLDDEDYIGENDEF
ncbi:MAG: hypothetical protein ACTSPZ_06750 [Promethearchaeota archaeon]